MPLPLPIALQLYTIRDIMSRDFEGTLEAVAGIGYRQVEFAGLYDRAPKVVKALCDKLGLQPISFHVGLDAVRPAKIQETITLAKTLDARYIVIPAAPGDLRNPDGYRQIAAVLTEAQNTAGAAGLRICYHNHAFEYDKSPDGTNGMDILFGSTATQTNYASELDVYWVTKGGSDPVATIQKYTGRVPLLHIKDMANTPEKSFAEVGTGIIPFKDILAVAHTAGVKHLIVEQDNGWIDADPMKSVTISYQNLKKLVG